MSAQS